MLKAVFFDLDGTLLRIDEQQFVKLYFKLLSEKLAGRGYDAKTLMDSIWKGTALMMKNDGSKSNEQVFWNFFKTVYPGCEKDKPLFDSFYQNEFKQLNEICQVTETSKRVVMLTKELGLLPVLSTNPLFPMDGQRTRLSFLGLRPEDFAYVTSYENSCYCKPNPKYFQSLLDKFNLKSDEVIVFGNNDFEDGDCASSLGIKVYLVDGYLIHSSQAKGKYEVVEYSKVGDLIKALADK